MPGTEDHKQVLIIGAGSTGFALAQGLRKANIKSIIFEKHESLNYHERDWNMGMHWAAPILQSLIPEDAWNRLQSVQVDPNEPPRDNDPLNFVNSQTGEIMGAAVMSKFYRLRRSKLRALLAPNLDIRYSKKLVDISYPSENSVAAHFSDGTIEIGYLLVGADGASSMVRQHLCGIEAAQPNRLPFAATFIQASYPRETALYLRSFHPLFYAGIHPAGYFGFFGMHDATSQDLPESWTFFFYLSWKCSVEEQDASAHWSNEQRLNQARELARSIKVVDPWKTAYENLADDHPVWYMTFRDWDPSAHPWDNRDGRVTLAGDAAHTMTYQRGQGLNNSITDAGNLVKATTSFVDNNDLEKRKEAIDRYEEEMVKRAGEEVRVSTQNTRMLHVWEEVLQSPVMKGGMHRNKN